MKLKYYMRGIGVGIVFTVLLFFFLRPEKGLSNDEIISAAKKLGMVEAEPQDINLDAIKSPTPPPVTTGGAVTDSEDEDITPLPSPSPSPAPTLSPTPAPEETPTDKPEPTNAVSEEEEYITVNIVQGMTSWKFALYAKQVGLIENVEEFDSYLVKNGYANRIRVNKFNIKKGSSYYEIAEKITGR